MSSDTLEQSTLVKWALENGCIFNCAKICLHPVYGGLGLFNSKDTAPHDAERTAIFIPNSLIITFKSIEELSNESDQLADVFNALLPVTASGEHSLAIFLLYQVHLDRAGTPGKWSTYVNNLPKSSLAPYTWNDQEIEFLFQSFSSISRAVPAKVASTKSIYESVHQIPGWFQSVSWQDYLLAVFWVSSRALESPGKTDQAMLVPILDMANHSRARNAAWEVTDKGIELRREPVEVAADEEIVISYDVLRGTGERVYRYGFIEDLSPLAVTNELTLLTPDPPMILGGTRCDAFILMASSVRDAFRDLSFFTYANWYHLAPV
jgi:hypothetical protein